MKGGFVSGFEQRFRFAKSLFVDSDVIRQVISSVRHYYPSWARKLCVVKNRTHRIDLAHLSDGDAATSIIHAVLDTGGTYDNLERLFGSVRDRRRIGSAEISGSDKSLTLTILMDDEIFPSVGGNRIWGNSIILQRCGVLSRPGKTIELASEIFWALCADVEPDYACAALLEEFDRKNLARDNKGVYAVGNNIESCFPGLYWENYFGLDITKCLWGRLPTMPDCVEMIAKGRGVGFRLGLTPFGWDSAERKACENLVLIELGETLFFDPYSPIRAGSEKLRGFVESWSAARPTPRAASS